MLTIPSAKQQKVIFQTEIYLKFYIENDLKVINFS